MADSDGTNFRDDPAHLTSALDGARDCQTVLVLGINPDGTFYAAASTADRPTLIDMLEQFKFGVYAGNYD